MATQNLSPTKLISPKISAPKNQQLPTLPLTANSQVFIHPEHEQGNLIISKPSKKSKRLFLPLILLISTIGLVSSIAILFFYFIPKAQAVNYAKNTKELVSSSSEKLDKVSSSLNILYKARTAQTEDVTLTKVLEANTLKRDVIESNIFKNTQKIVSIIRHNFEKNSNVKGYTVPNSDPSFEIRKHRDLARDIGKKTLEAEKILEEITDLKNQNVPQSAQEVKEDISALEENSSNYIDQANKCSNYYIDVSDASIELQSLANSINTPKDLDTTISKFSALKSKFSNYQDLPEEIESYNNDLVELFTLSATYITEIRDAVKNNDSRLMPNTLLFNSQMQSIATRAVNDEISFWQNNESLSSYDDLSKEHTDLLSSSQKLKDKNYFFFLKWLGVD